MKLYHSNIYIILIVILISSNSCIDLVKTNVLQSSFDVEQSKANGVYVAEYIPSKNDLNFKNQSSYIQQVWIEHNWVYKNQNKDIEIENSQAGYIKLKNDEDIFTIDFIRDNEKNGGITGRKLFFNISEIKDTLSFKFYLGNDTIPIKMYKRVH
jgi:hypothetical protein